MAARHEPPRNLPFVLVLRLPAAVTFRMPGKRRSGDAAVDVVSVTEERDRCGNTPSSGLARIIRQRNSLAVSQVGTPCQSVRRSSSGGAPSRDGGFAGGGRGSRCRIPSPASVPSERSASPPAELSAFPATVSGDAACRRRRQTPFSGAPGRGGRFRSGLCMTVNLIGSAAGKAGGCIGI